MRDTQFLAWPFFADAHRELKNRLDAWCREHESLFTSPGDDLDQTCRALVRELGEGGWLRYTVPAEYGGATTDLDVRSLCLIRETLAYHSGLADFVFAMQGLGSGPIGLAGSAAMRDEYLPKVASGEKIAGRPSLVAYPM